MYPSRAKSEDIVLRREQIVVYFLEGSVTLLEGAANCCYAPLQLNVRYSFKEHGVTFEVPNGARISLEGKYKKNFDEYNNSLDEVVRVIDEARAQALIDRESNGGRRKNDDDNVFLLGPRVMFIGSSNTGKSYNTLAVANEAVRTGDFSLAYVDTDVGQQVVSCPGTVSCALITEVLPVVSPFAGLRSTSYFLGVVAAPPRRDNKKYLELCRCCKDVIANNAITDAKLDCGGAIINTMGWVEGNGLTLLCEQVVIFEITHIILTEENEELETAIRAAAAGLNHEVYFLHVKPSPSIAKTNKKSSFFRHQQIMRYFLGTPEHPLKCPHATCKISSVEFYDSLTLKPIADLHSIRPNALCSCSVEEDKNLRKSRSAGFIIITEIGDDFFGFISPFAGRLPSRLILVSPIIDVPSHLIPPVE